MNTQKIMTSGEVQKTALRLPRPLHEQIHRAAAANGRTMNAEIVARLAASFEGDPNTPLGWEELKLLPPGQQHTIKAVIRAMLPPEPSK